MIPDLLAGSESMMIGQTLWLEFFTNKDWPVASAAAVALLVLLVPLLLLYDRLQRRQLEGRLMARQGQQAVAASTSPRWRSGWRFCTCRS